MLFSFLKIPQLALTLIDLQFHSLETRLITKNDLMLLIIRESQSNSPKVFFHTLRALCPFQRTSMLLSLLLEEHILHLNRKTTCHIRLQLIISQAYQIHDKYLSVLNCLQDQLLKLYLLLHCVSKCKNAL